MSVVVVVVVVVVAVINFSSSVFRVAVSKDSLSDFAAEDSVSRN